MGGLPAGAKSREPQRQVRATFAMRCTNEPTMLLEINRLAKRMARYSRFEVVPDVIAVRRRTKRETKRITKTRLSCQIGIPNWAVEVGSAQKRPSFAPDVKVTHNQWNINRLDRLQGLDTRGMAPVWLARNKR